MNNKFYNVIFSIIFITSANPQSNLNDIINSVSTAEIITTINEISGFVPVTIEGQQQTILARHSDIYHPGNLLARKYIQQKLASCCLTTKIQSFKPEFGGENVISQLTGYKYPNQKYIISAHYDDEPYNTPIAPGADDDASGVAGVLEAARILKGYSFPYTIEFIFFDEEEHNLGGSLYYAQNAYAAGDSILGVINLDMIGFDSNNDYAADLNSKDTALSHALSTIIFDINNTYQIGLNFRYLADGRESGDQKSFWQYGYTANWIEESHSYDFNTRYHTVSDSVTYINSDYITRIVKVATAAMATLASEEHLLPVELSSFNAVVSNKTITLHWCTSEEINNLGFEVQRCINNDPWITLGFIKGQGSCHTETFYQFTDTYTNESSIIRYRLKQIDTDSNIKYSKEIRVEPSLVIKGYKLEQNYPNPFNPSTTINFAFQSAAHAQLSVFDILGNKVTELFNGLAEQGKLYQLNFNAVNLSSGVYFYKLTGNGISEMRKMILLR